MGQQIALALRESMHRVLFKLASFLPGLLALLVAVALLTTIGVLLSLVLRRILTAAKFDERFARSQSANVTDWSPGNSPTALIGRIAFWACVILGCIIGISAFDASYAGNSQISAILIPYLTHSVGAILIFIAGTLIARFLARSVLIGAVNLQMQYARFLSLGIKWLVLVLTGAMVLDHLQIGGVVVELAFGILFGGIVLTLALAIGLGSRDLVSRSLEKSADPRSPAPIETDFADILPRTAPPQPRPSETLRHF
ncbi:MAG: hypothetical protein M3O31_07125 [Acidobacteriota bacterium]|nr:hypothetical protein [Acidobacteriota bacterium]